jgi:hypothetical protein
MNLIEAIASVLAGSNGLTAKQIAERVNSGLYTRADNKPVPPHQVNIRLGKYPSYFTNVRGKWYKE